MFEIFNGQRWIFAGFLLTARTWVIYLAMKVHVPSKADFLNLTSISYATETRPVKDVECVTSYLPS